MREQDHVADRGGAGEQHHQAVDADPLARGGRHAVFEGGDVILVVHHRLVVAPGALPRLVPEPLGLVVRVVELGETVRDLPPADEELEAVGHFRVVVASPGERRDLGGIVGDEGGCDEPRLGRVLEELDEGLSRTRLVAERDAAGAGGLPDPIGVVDVVGRDPGGMAQHRVANAQPLEGGTKVDPMPLPLHNGLRLAVAPFPAPPRLRRREGAEQHLGKVHELPVVGVRLVELEHGELGVVPGGEPLVAEVPVDLEHPLEPAHHEALQVQLRGDPEEERDAEGVVPGLERAGHRAARERLHHRRLHLEEAPLGEEASHEVHHPGAGAEGLARLLVHDEIEVAPPVARLPVSKPVELLGQGAKRLREQPQTLHAQRQLAGPGAERDPLRPHEVPDVPAAEVPVRTIRKVLPPQVELKAPGAVLDVGEARLAHHPPAHHPPGDAIAAGREGVVVEALALAADVVRGRGRAEVVRVRVAAFAQGGELLAPARDLLVLRGRRVPRCAFALASSAGPRTVVHAPTPALRLASTKGSRSPSSIPWVLPVSTPVRRSLIRD